MGKPAARVTDMHTCPMVNPGPVPHVGGPILPPCKVTVLTGKLPQARISDRALCVGPPDVIAMGSTTVLVGGLPAARLGDTTAHGGVIVAGCFTVLIGDAGSGGSGGAGGTAAMAAAAAFSEPNLQAQAMIAAAAAGAPFCEHCHAAASNLPAKSVTANFSLSAGNSSELRLYGASPDDPPEVQRVAILLDGALRAKTFEEQLALLKGVQKEPMGEAARGQQARLYKIMEYHPEFKVWDLQRRDEFIKALSNDKKVKDAEARWILMNLDEKESFARYVSSVQAKVYHFDTVEIEFIGGMAWNHYGQFGKEGIKINKWITYSFYDTLNTVVHESAHAMQWQLIHWPNMPTDDPRYVQVDAWRANFTEENLVRSPKDVYARQPVELHAHETGNVVEFGVRRNIRGFVDNLFD